MKKVVCVLLLVSLIMLVPLGCKKEQSQQGPIQTPMEDLEDNNPLTIILTNIIEKRDSAFALLSEKLSHYQYSGTGKDHSELAQTVMIPYTEANTELLPLTLNTILMQDDGSGNRWEINTQDRTGNIEQDGDNFIMQCVSVGEEVEGITPSLRQRCNASKDGTRLIAELYSTVTGQEEVLSMLFEYQNREGVHYIQAWYSQDFGNEYTLIRMVFTENTMQYGVYDYDENEAQIRPASIINQTFEPTEEKPGGIFEGFITKVNYDGSKAVIVNEGETFTIE